MPLEGVDHLELWVGNATQAAYFYTHAMGFTPVAYVGLETGVRDRVSWVLEQGRVRFVLTAPLGPEGEIAEHVRRHGDGVRTVALAVPDADKAWIEATGRGATSAAEPSESADTDGVLRTAAIRTYGDTIHRFVDRSSYRGPFAPGYRAIGGQPGDRSGVEGVGIRDIDHVVGNVELGRMQEWVRYYEDVFGMTEMIHFSDEDISTEYSALMSKVCVDGSGRVKFPINEPAAGRRRSQIEEYLDYYGSPGVQHVALATDDILHTVGELRRRGVDFLTVPTSYYDELQDRVGQIDEPVDELAKLGILVDRDPDGYLLQIFSKPVQDRPTVFYEIIQRKGARSFGKGNFKALFEAIEREQALRGNL
jgi:4-hydroxyphenylpyruvate dioxygenase